MGFDGASAAMMASREKWYREGEGEGGNEIGSESKQGATPNITLYY